MIIIFDEYKFNWTKKEIQTVKNMIFENFSIKQIAKETGNKRNDIRLLVYWLTIKREV